MGEEGVQEEMGGREAQKEKIKQEPPTLAHACNASSGKSDTRSHVKTTLGYATRLYTKPPTPKKSEKREPSKTVFSTGHQFQGSPQGALKQNGDPN